MKSQIKITYRDKDNNIIENPVEGQRAFSPETKQLYVFTNGEWEMIKAEGGLKVSAYELNKQIIAQLENIDYNEDAMKEGKEIINNLQKQVPDSYFMLLCRDCDYYTIFNIKKDRILNTFADEVIDCAHDLGAIKSINPAVEDAVEIWVHPVDEEEPTLMMLFPYDRGIIECMP